MPVNDMVTSQLGVVLQEIVSQATGTEVQAPIDTSSFINVGIKALMAKPDTLLNAISQVLTKTIYKNRPYEPIFRGIETTAENWGNHVRVLNMEDYGIDDVDNSETLVDGSPGSDQWIVNKPKVYQSNYYGKNKFVTKPFTTFRDQLNTAFQSPQALNAFLTMRVQNRADVLKQATENLLRATLANSIGAVITSRPADVVHLVTEYNALTGESLTSASIYETANFSKFMLWVFSKIQDVSNMMRERTSLYHTNPTGKFIMKHSPLESQLCYFSSQHRTLFESMVSTTIFHPDRVKTGATEYVNFWQSPDNRLSINVTAGYATAAGVAATAAVQQDGILCTLIDKNAVGGCITDVYSLVTPMHAADSYMNEYTHYTARFFNDNMENMVVFVLD